MAINQAPSHHSFLFSACFEKRCSTPIRAPVRALEHVGSRLLSLTANHSSPYEQAEGLQRYTPPLPGLLAYGYTDLPGQCHGTSLHRLTPNPLTCGRFRETPVPRTIEIEDATPQDPFSYLRGNLRSYEAYRINQGSPWDCSRIFSWSCEQKEAPFPSEPRPYKMC